MKETGSKYFTIDLAFGDKRERDFWELSYPVIGCFVVLFVRYVLNKFIFEPLGIWFGLKKNYSVKKPLSNPILEEFYHKSRKWDHSKILELSKRLGLSAIDIEEWFNLKLAQDKPTVLKMFCDSCWEFSFLTMMCGYGLVALWDKPWLWDVKECWTDFFNQTVSNDVWLYFMLCFSFTWAQLITIAATHDIRVRDAQMFIIHHVALIITMTLSWRANLFRFIVVALLTSDICDVFLQASKIAKLLKYEKTERFGFFTFVAVWMFGRWGLHVFWLQRSFLWDVPEMLPTVPTYFVYYAIVGLSFVFVVLTAIWTYFILKIFTKLMISAKTKTL